MTQPDLSYLKPPTPPARVKRSAVSRKGLALAVVAAAATLIMLLFTFRSLSKIRPVDALMAANSGAWVEVLEERGSMAVRLDAELKRAREVPNREQLLVRVEKKARKIDRLGAERRDAELLDLVAPVGDEGRDAVSELIVMIQGTKYLDLFTDRRVEAASSLAMFPSEEGMEALIRVLSDSREPDYLRSAVAEALEQMEDYRARDALDKHWNPDSRRASSGHPSSNDAQSPRELSSASRDVRRNALAKLSTQTGEQSERDLIYGLEDPDPELRALSARSLARRSGGVDGRQAHKALVRFIAIERQRSPLLAATQGLRACGEEETTALLQAYYDVDQSIRPLVMKAMAKCQDERVVDPMLAALQAPEGELTLAAENAILTLGSRRNRWSIEPLIQSLSQDYPIRAKRTVAKALAQISGQQHGVDVDAWNDWWQNHRWDDER